jgi:hypothetical protein
MPKKEIVVHATTPDREQPTKKLLAVLFAGALAAVAVVECTSAATQRPSGEASKSSHPTAPTNSTSALQITFRMLTPDNEIAAMFDYDAVVQHGSVRLTIVAYADESGSHPQPLLTVTYDGTRELIREGGNAYQLFDNAAQAKWATEPALDVIAQFLPFDPRAAYSQSLCPNAKQVQDGTNLGRSARKYSCAKTAGHRPRTIWIDQAFGIALSPLCLPERRSPRIRASRQPPSRPARRPERRSRWSVRPSNRAIEHPTSR